MPTWLVFAGSVTYYVIITCTVHMRNCVCNHKVGMRMSSFVVDSVIRGSMAQTFSFANAIMDDGSTLLNGPFGSGKLVSLEEGFLMIWKHFKIPDIFRSLTACFSHVILIKWTDKWKSLDGLSLANALLFTKFTKLSRFTVLVFTINVSKSLQWPYANVDTLLI